MTATPQEGAGHPLQQPAPSSPIVLTPMDRNMGLSRAADPYVLAVCEDVYRSMAPVTIRRGTPDEDMKRGTDAVATATDCRFAYRARGVDYLHRAAIDFTIRSKAAYGGRTEIDKIRDGDFEAAYMVYAVADCTRFDLDTITGLVAWRVIRVDDIRDLLNSPEWADPDQQDNTADPTAFVAIKWTDLPPEAIVSQFGLPPVSYPQPTPEGLW